MHTGRVERAVCGARYKERQARLCGVCCARWHEQPQLTSHRLQVGQLEPQALHAARQRYEGEGILVDRLKCNCLLLE